MTVKKSARQWACILGSSVFAMGAGSAANAAIKTGDASAPYDAIGVRNIFDLHDVPVQEPPPTNVVLPRVYLTGISTILGMKQAYFVVQWLSVPGKPAAADKYFTLSEGQKQAMLEVLAIDPKAKSVKINNSGTISTITFEANQIAFNGTPAGPPGGNAPNPGGGLNLNLADPHHHQPNARTTGQAPQLDPDQQMVLMELQREASKAQVGSGQLPPLPPTPLSEVMQQEQQQQPTTSPSGPSQPVFPGQHNTLK